MHMYADKEQIRLERLKAIEQSDSRKKGSENERADSPSKSSDKESSKSERSRESVSKSRDNSIARRRSSSTSSSSVSSKQSTVSQKARRSDGNMKLEVDKHYFAHIDSAENNCSYVGSNELGDTLRLGKEKELVFDGEDRGSKLNFKKSSTENSARQKSPLRTEIDDDEYCRVISNRDSPARKMTPPPSPILDGSLNSPVQKILGNSGSVTNLLLRFPSDGSSSDEERDTSKNKRDWTRSRVPCMHMDADEEQIRLGINSNVEQDTSKKKGVCTRRKVPRMSMYADEEQIRLRINSNVEQDTSKKKGYWTRSKMPRMRMYADEEQIRLRISSDEQDTSKKKGDWTRTKVPRMRMYADEEQGRLGISCDEEQDTSKKKGDWTRIKVPRMRMYADEEQIRLKRLKTIERSDSRKKGSKRECEDSSERSRVRICGDLRSKLSKDCRKHSGRVKSNSSSSSSVSSKRSKVSQKAQHSDGHGEKRNFKKTSVENSATQTSPQHTRQSSPQRIELDGEEYVRVISYRGSPPRKMTPPPSAILDESQNSSVQTRPGNSGHLTNLPSRAEINFDKEPNTSKKEDGKQIRLERLKAIEHSDSRKKGSVWERNNRDSSKHVSRARAMSREDLQSSSGKVSQGHSAKEKNSISSSSKQSNFSQKALLSYGHMDSESQDVSNVSGNVLRDALGFGKRKGMVLHGKDLRSKLNFKKTSKEDSPRPKSTQHIELDGEEYVRVIKYRGSPPRKMTPPPSPVQDGSQNSSVQKHLRNSEEEQIQLERHEAIDHSHSRKEGSECEHKDSRIKSCVVVSSKSERNRESVSKSRESSKHVSRSRARSREDLRSMPGKDSQGHSAKEKNSSGSSSSSKQSKISQKALRSYVHVDSHLDINKHYSAHKDSDDSDVGFTESRDTSRLDLRSKPSCKKTSKENFARQKSPLIGNRDSPPRKMTPPSSPIRDGSRNSSVQKHQRNPGRLTNLSSRFQSDGLISEQDTSKKERHKAIEHSDSRKKDSKREGKDSCSKSSVKESSKSERSRESVSKNRDSSKHASRTRARSSSNSSASSKCSKISRKALHSVVMRTQK